MKKYLSFAVYLLTFSVGFFLSSFLVENGDIFFYLAIGEFFFENGHLPKTDPYSFQTIGQSAKTIKRFLGLLV